MYRCLGREDEVLIRVNEFSVLFFVGSYEAISFLYTNDVGFLDGCSLSDDYIQCVDYTYLKGFDYLIWKLRVLGYDLNAESLHKNIYSIIFNRLALDLM